VPDKNGDPTVLTLTWFPLSRDCFFYILSLVILMMGFSGDEVTWYEALSMMGVYFAYVTFMIFNGKIEKWATSKFSKAAPEADEEEAVELKEKPKTKLAWQTVASKAASEATGKKSRFYDPSSL
jgi:Ca2+/Na+ antiporter